MAQRGRFMSEADQRKTVDLDRGLFFVNYRSAEDPAAPPKVIVAPARGDEGQFEFILHPDASEPTLWEPNSGFVIRARAPGRLQIEVLPMRPGGSRAAVVRIEPIQSGRIPAVSRGRVESGRAGSAVKGDGLKVLAHVAGIGDTTAGPNTWIAGPASPSRIEGIALDWADRPDGVEIRYAVQFLKGQSGSGKMVPLGAFAGTRGRAMPLTGVVLEMAGNNEFEFVAEALFLNAPTLRAIGQRVVLSGPTGREPLVGLRIAVERADRAIAASSTAAAPAKTPTKPSGSGRVRVFRSRPRQTIAVD